MHLERISAADADGFFWMEDNNLPAEIRNLNTLELDMSAPYYSGSYILTGPFQSTNNSNLIFTVSGKNEGEDGWQKVKFFKRPGADQIAPYFIVSDTTLSNNGRLITEEWRVWNDAAGLVRGKIIDSLGEEDNTHIWNEILERDDNNNNNSNNNNNNYNAFENVNEDPSSPRVNANVTTNNPSGGKRKVRKARSRKTKRARKTKAKHTRRRK
jgi:hypothetical protein